MNKPRLVYWPTESKNVTSPYGPRGSEFHWGTDIGALVPGVEGDEVKAMFESVCVKATYDQKGYGFYVVMQHPNGFTALYAHLQGIDIEVGQRVKAGARIGRMGNSGSSSAAHLHVEVHACPYIYPDFFYTYSREKYTRDVEDLLNKRFISDNDDLNYLVNAGITDGGEWWAGQIAEDKTMKDIPVAWWMAMMRKIVDRD